MIFAGSFRGAKGYFSAPLKYLNIVFVASGDRLSPIRTVDSLFSHQPLNVLVELVIGFGMITFENSKATVDITNVSVNYFCVLKKVDQNICMTLKNQNIKGCVTIGVSLGKIISLTQ